MIERLKKHQISFKNAFAGLKYAFSTQPNFLIHGLLSILVIIVGVLFRITSIEMTILILTIVIGLSAEMINTSLESITDLVTEEWRENAKIAKDVSAGMMLLTATGAVFIAFIILAPYFVRYFWS